MARENGRVVVGASVRSVGAMDFGIVSLLAFFFSISKRRCSFFLGGDTFCRISIILDRGFYISVYTAF